MLKNRTPGLAMTANSNGKSGSAPAFCKNEMQARRFLALSLKALIFFSIPVKSRLFPPFPVYCNIK